MKSVQISVLASAVGIALLGVGAASDLAAAPLQQSQAVSAVSVSPVGRYIVTFVEAGLANYKGGTNGLSRTAPDSDLVVASPSRKFEINSAASQSYKSYLSTQRSEHVAAIEQALGASSPFAIPTTLRATRSPLK